VPGRQRPSPARKLGVSIFADSGPDIPIPILVPEAGGPTPKKAVRGSSSSPKPNTQRGLFRPSCFPAGCGCCSPTGETDRRFPQKSGGCGCAIHPVSPVLPLDTRAQPTFPSAPSIHTWAGVKGSVAKSLDSPVWPPAVLVHSGARGRDLKSAAASSQVRLETEKPLLACLARAEPRTPGGEWQETEIACLRPRSRSVPAGYGKLTVSAPVPFPGLKRLP